MTSALCCFTKPWCAQPEGCVSSFCLRGVGGNFLIYYQNTCVCVRCLPPVLKKQSPKSTSQTDKMEEKIISKEGATYGSAKDWGNVWWW